MLSPKVLAIVTNGSLISATKAPITISVAPNVAV
jgi:hypothetical protein